MKVAPPANANELVQRIHTAMSGAGLQPGMVNLAGFNAVVGGSSTFKWQWMATKLHWFIYATVMAPGTPADALDRYLDDACQDAINRKGAMRGAQSGVAAVTVVAIDGVAPEVERWATKPHGRRFAALTFPVLAEVGAAKVVRPERMMLGGIYTGFLKDLVRQYVETPMRG